MYLCKLHWEYLCLSPELLEPFIVFWQLFSFGIYLGYRGPIPTSSIAWNSHFIYSPKPCHSGSRKPKPVGCINVLSLSFSEAFKNIEKLFACCAKLFHLCCEDPCWREHCNNSQWDPGATSSLQLGFATAGRTAFTGVTAAGSGRLVAQTDFVVLTTSDGKAKGSSL